MVAAKIASLPKGANQHSSNDLPTQKGANQHASNDAPSQDKAAALLNVGRASVQRAREVQEKGAPELVAAVERGDISVSKAASIAEAPPEFQKRVVERVRSGEKPVEAVRQERMLGREAAPLPKGVWRQLGKL